MKRVLLIQISLIIIISFFGCDNTTETDTDVIVSQVLFFYAYHYDSYWNDQTNEIVNVENTTGGGVVFADPIPSFEYYKMGDSTYSGEEYFNYYPGYISFGDFNDNVDVRLTSNFNPLNIEVKTSLGKLSGSIVLPDTIVSLTLSEYDTLELGNSFTISWSGSNANFYTVYCRYTWIDNDGNWYYEYLNDFVSGTSITYPGSIFSHNGEIEYIGVQPMNGPIPVAGSEGNMSGEGSGFLYYQVEPERYDGDGIIVGTGYGNSNLAKTASSSRSEQQIELKIREKLESTILAIN